MSEELETNLGESAVCARLRSALREARSQLRRLETEYINVLILHNFNALKD